MTHFIQQKASIGSDNCSAPNRRQAIIRSHVHICVTQPWLFKCICLYSISRIHAHDFRFVVLCWEFNKNYDREMFMLKCRQTTYTLCLKSVTQPRRTQENMSYESIETYDVTYWGREKMATISKTTFSNVFFNATIWISFDISLKFVPKVRIKNIPVLI